MASARPAKGCSWHGRAETLTLKRQTTRSSGTSRRLGTVLMFLAKQSNVTSNSLGTEEAPVGITFIRGNQTGLQGGLGPTSPSLARESLEE